MRSLILTLSCAGLLLVGCSDDTSSGTPDSGKPDMGAQNDGGKPDQGKPIKDQAAPKPDQAMPKPDASAKPSCKAWDAKGVGACSMFLGYIWDGATCKGISGCSCGGTDCKFIYKSPTACATGQAHCGPTPSCKPMDVKGIGPCKKLLGWWFDGKQCKSLGGCSCGGADCAKLFPNSAACQKAYAACP